MNTLNYGDIVRLIPVGREHPIDRWDLKERALTSDRRVRDLIEEARANGVPIHNFGQGYFISYDAEDLSRTVAMDRARVASINKRLKPMADMLAQIPGQTTINLGVEE